MDGVLRSRSWKLAGILNGVDYAEWSPENDSHVAAKYSASDLAGKRECKIDLLREMGLPRDNAGRPLVGMISRLAYQKGMDVAASIVPWLVEQGAFAVVLGSGDPAVEGVFHSLASAYPNNVGVRIGYDDSLAHRIEAGSDIFLMPSRYEPCGLNQIYSLRYGTVPVVRATGGLADTVEDTTGFKFDLVSADQIIGALSLALQEYQDPDAWMQRMRLGMSKDFSWDVSARQYHALYESALSSAPVVP